MFLTWTRELLDTDAYFKVYTSMDISSGAASVPLCRYFLRYLAGLRISCSIFTGSLVGTPDVVLLCIVYMLPALYRPAVC